MAAMAASSFLPVMKYEELEGGPLLGASLEGDVQELAGSSSSSSSLASSPPSPPQTPARGQLPSALPSAEASELRAAAGAALSTATAAAGGGPQGQAAAAGAGGPRKAPPRQVPKRLTPVEMRAKAVFRALEKLMEGCVDGEEQLWAVARILSADEYEQVAEERSLAGLCGNPLCLAPAPPPLRPGGGKYKIDLPRHMVYAKEAPPPFCSADCEEAAARFAARLGSHHAAQHRFELLMQAAKQGQQGQGAASAAAQPAVAGAGQASSKPSSATNGLSDSPAPSVPSAGPQAAASAAQELATAGTPMQGQPAGRVVLTAESPSSPKDISRVKWDHGIVPSQWNAMGTRGNSSSSNAISSNSSSSSSSSSNGISSNSNSSNIPGSGCCSAGTGSNSRCQGGSTGTRAVAGAGGGKGGRGPKGVLKTKAGAQYAAGTPKTPIMLAEVKERDPSMVAADTVRSLPPDVVAGTRAAATSRVGPRAVEGYVPRAGKSQFRQLAQPPRSQQQQQQVAAAGGLEAQRRRVRFSDEEGGSLEMPSAAELAASAAAVAAAASAAEEVPLTAGTTPAKLPSSGAGEQQAAAGAGPSQSEEPAVQQPRQQAAAASSASAAASPGAADAVGSGRHGAAAAAAKAPGGLAVGGGISWGPDEPGSPMLVFDIEDPQGPLDVAGAAAGEAGGLAAHFGRLRVANAGEVAAAGAADAGAHATQQVQQQPRSPQHPLASAALSTVAAFGPAAAQQEQQMQAQGALNVEEVLQRQMQSSLRRLFPRLGGTLPAEMDAGLEAELASEDEGSEVESAGWSSSEEEEERMAPGGEGSDDEGAAAGVGAGARRPSSYRLTLSFFGTLFTNVESWITDATLDLLASGPGADLPPSAAALPPPSPQSQQISAALARFMAAALPLVATQLRIGAARSEMERALNELLRTMRFVGPLPPFKSSQWQLVAIIFLKALSLERCPALRDAFETREGVQRLGKALAGLAFTVEEFYAVLELLCPAEEG